MGNKNHHKYRERIAADLPTMLAELKNIDCRVEECPDERYRLHLKSGRKLDWWPFTGTCKDIHGAFSFESFLGVDPILENERQHLQGKHAPTPNPENGRDTFAIAALQGMLANGAFHDTEIEIADRAYLYADAMLAARSK